MRKLLFLLFFGAFILGVSCKRNTKEIPQTENPMAVQMTAEEYAQLGNKKLYVEWEYDEAKSALLKAVELNPNDDLSHANLAWYWMLEGNKEKSMEHIVQAKQANPEQMIWVQWHGWLCYFYDDFDCADRYLREAIEMEPNQRDAYFTLSRMNYRNGNMEEAIVLAQRAAQDSTGRGALAFYHIYQGDYDLAREIAVAIEQEPKDPYELMIMVPIYNLIGEREKALDWLEKNYELRQPLLPWLRYMPIMRPLHGEERFQNIVAQIGGPEGGKPPPPE